MQTRKLGKVEVSAAGLDCRGMSLGYGAEVPPAVEQLGIRFVPYTPLGNVFHATGKRIREVPVTPDKLL